MATTAKNKKKNANAKNNDGNIKVVSGKKNKMPRKLSIETIQQTVPIFAIHEKYGLIETYPNCYVKSYYIGDNNYMTAPDDEQAKMFADWRRLLNSFGTNMEFAVSINNRTMSENDIRETNMIKETGDPYDYLRKQMNKIITDRVRDGKNSIRKDKYLTVAVHEPSPAKASMVFGRLDKSIDQAINRIGGSSAKPISLEDMLDVLYGLYNDPSEHFIQKSKIFDNKGDIVEVSSFDFDNMRRMGLTINDLIGPVSIEIKPTKMRMGKKWVRTLKVSSMPSQLRDDFISKCTDMSFDCLTTINYKAIPTRETDTLINTNLTMIRDEKVKRIRQGQRNGVYDDSFIPAEVLDREAEALTLRDDIRENDEKLFKTTLTVSIFANNEEELEQYTEIVITEYKRASAQLTTMVSQQEEGFNSTLPLCYNQIKAKRTLKSSSAAILLPFDILELNDPGGINYSCNLVSKNLLVANRLSYANFNSFILGSSGSGKSFSAKTEMLNVFLKSNADIVVIDPENEYGELARMLGGEVIEIRPGGANKINPMEVAYTDNDDASPLQTKVDFILRLFEVIHKSAFGLSSVQEGIIDECVRKLYSPFIDDDGNLDIIPADQMPTLTDLQKELAKRPEREALELAGSLKLYTGEGSLNVFGSHSTVNINNRFVVYQIRDVNRLTSLAMLTILDHIWNQVVENKKLGKNTWFYVDEIYLLFQNETSAEFLEAFFRRARKYGGVPTGITQNVTPLLESKTGREMLQNCEFVQILKQSGPDREQLRTLFNLSETQISYITASPKGQGLIYNGRNVIPFYSSFPKDNDCYKVMTSDQQELKQYALEKKREEAKRNRDKQ